MRHQCLRFLQGFLLVVVLAACCVMNAEGRHALNLIPRTELHAQAAAAYEERRSSDPVNTDPRLNRIVRRVTDRLIAVAQRDYGPYCAGFEWEVTVFQSSEANAWCMPGGKMGVYTGILPVCETEAALAAVMGHEISHALLEHGNERMSQVLGASAALGVLGIALEDPEDDNTKRERKRALLIAAGLGADLGVIKPFSRAHESEADVLGLKILAAAGYDPEEAPRLWERMDAATAGQQPPEFLSTHPAPSTRVATLRSLLPQVRPLYQSAPQKHGLGESF